MGRMPSEDLGTPPFKHKTGFKPEVLIDESVIYLSLSSPKIIVLSFILKWVANFGLKKLKMDISRRIGPNCTHQRSAWSPAAAKHCSVLPSVEVNVRGACCLSCLPSATSGSMCGEGLPVTATRHCGF